MSGFSFKLSKTIEKKVLQDSKIRDDSTKDAKNERDFIKDVSDKKITGTIVKKKEEELVIPLISKNKWRSEDAPSSSQKDDKKSAKTGDKKSASEKLENLSLEQQAARELIEDSKRQLEELEKGDTGPEVNEVPLLLSNAVPKGFETDENLDVSLRAEQSNLDDYENVPVEKFGMAMLRGMGWKADEGIGGFKKQVIKTIDPVVRPKGLGLGATKPKDNKTVIKDGDEKLELKKGAYVQIISGKQTGLYGEVEGIDEETARVVLKLALGGEKTSVSENSIKLVTKKEFKDWGKIVNKDKYTKYKEEHFDVLANKNGNGKHRSPSPNAMVDDGSESRKRKSEKESSKTSAKYSRSASRSPEVKKAKSSRRTWVRPDLKVRCIDKKYKDGRYYNEKVVVIDVVTNDSCDCKTEEGKILQDMRTDKLETVIPREMDSVVQIVGGDYSGELAQLVDKDKNKYRAYVRLLTSQKVVTKDYEDICSYTGRVEEYD
eukprot:TRINITY_DN3899_c0_g1_i8.p1 TRINITY_DN3899_c0_g1~~TRINITY_DN3899_c0_g1_i8.p1  ORF type:complete len:504 (-),score=114.45 TRINITY_DN3899_c0_g1_i8:10-1476(-)